MSANPVRTCQRCGCGFVLGVLIVFEPSGPGRVETVFEFCDAACALRWNRYRAVTFRSLSLRLASRMIYESPPR